MASRLQLASGPEIAYSYRPGLPGAPLLVFLNGMMLPAAGWKASIDPLPHTQAYLTYDRPGARDGLSPGLPPDAGAHDILDVVAQLQEVLKTLGINESTPLIVAANSIGCPIARLFASSPTTKHSIKAYLFLDSMVANSDYVSIFPDPTPDENPEVTQTRGLMKRMFHPSVPNGEKLDRRTIPQRLPMSDEPKLPGEPYVTVVGHDSKTFTENGAKVSAVLVPQRPFMSHRSRWSSLGWSLGLLKSTSSPSGNPTIRVLQP